LKVLILEKGAALYGEQGVNGVILVTTVRGAQDGGKLTVSVNSVVDFRDNCLRTNDSKNTGQGWFGAHDPFENGSWEEYLMM
jgi:hypothetical protein